jgi:MerR family transcriptional regulator, light-induced transcriptional regulator
VLRASGGSVPDELAIDLCALADTLVMLLPPDSGALAAQYVAAGAAHLAELPTTVPSFLRDDAPLAAEAKAYLQLLLAGDCRSAGNLILETWRHGGAVQDIYLHVFQCVQREVGRLWQTNQITAAQEHYCSAATQLIISQLYPYLFAGEKNGRKMVAACSGGEWHAIGQRIVADFLRWRAGISSILALTPRPIVSCKC